MGLVFLCTAGSRPLRETATISPTCPRSSSERQVSTMLRPVPRIRTRSAVRARRLAALSRVQATRRDSLCGRDLWPGCIAAPQCWRRSKGAGPDSRRAAKPRRIPHRRSAIADHPSAEARSATLQDIRHRADGGQNTWSDHRWNAACLQPAREMVGIIGKGAHVGCPDVENVLREVGRIGETSPERGPLFYDGDLEAGVAASQEMRRHQHPAGHRRR